MSDKHTPTPWNVIIDDKLIYIDSDLDNICDLYHFGFASIPVTKDNAEANAQFIVKACNAHDKLVEALEDMVKVFEYCSADYDDSDKVFLKAQALLKEVKEGKQ